jgi:transposase
MAEFGMIAAQRDAGLKTLIAIIADDDDMRLPAMARALLVLQLEHLRQIEARIAALDGRLVRQAREDDACRRLTEAPGIGPVIATAMVATVGNARLFSSGRSFAAWLGLTPRQHATGGKERLLGISKRGDGYLRRQLMHGARSLVRLAHGRERHPWGWINALLARRPFNVVVAAVANKLARMIWAMLSRGEAYRAGSRPRHGLSTRPRKAWGADGPGGERGHDEARVWPLGQMLGLGDHAPGAARAGGLLSSGVVCQEVVEHR